MVLVIVVVPGLLSEATFERGQLMIEKSDRIGNKTGPFHAASATDRSDL